MNRLDGEAKEVMRVKMICEVAHGSAQSVREGKEDPEWLDHERKRYEKHRAMAIDTAKAITDGFYQDTAVHNIIDLCVAPHARLRRPSYSVLYTDPTRVFDIGLNWRCLSSQSRHDA